MCIFKTDFYNVEEMERKVIMGNAMTIMTSTHKLGVVWNVTGLGN